MLRNKLFTLAIVLGLFTISFVACDNDDGTSPPAMQKSNIMVIHASPNAPGVDLLLDNSNAGTNLTFPNNTGYVEITSGMRNIKVNVTGTQTTVIEADLSFENNKNYSIFAFISFCEKRPGINNDRPALGEELL